MIAASLRLGSDGMQNQQGLRLTSLGKKELKNVDEEMEVYSVTAEAEPTNVVPDTKKIVFSCK